MIREGRHVMTSYHKGIPHVIAFTKQHHAHKALFEVDTRVPQNIRIDSDSSPTHLDIVKRDDVQFGKLDIDTVSYKTFKSYANHPKAPFLLLIDDEVYDTKTQLEFRGHLIFEA